MTIAVIGNIEILTGASHTIHIVDQNGTSVDHSKVTFQPSPGPVTALDPKVASIEAANPVQAGFVVRGLEPGEGVVRFIFTEGQAQAWVDFDVKVNSSVTSIGVQDGPAA